MDFFELVVVGIVAGAALLGVRMLAQTGNKRLFKEALDVQKGMISDLKTEVSKWKGRAGAAIAPPYGAENPEDVISKAIPRWARPFVKPLMEYASTEEGQATIKGLMDKFKKAPAGGEAQTSEQGV